MAPTSTGVVGALPGGQPADIKASGLLGGNASPDVPAGEPGKVAVVVVGPVPTDQSDLYSVPIIIRNSTNKAVGRVAVTASALDASGRPVPGLGRDTKGNLATVAYSQGFQPASIEPGQAALGAVYFRAKSTIPVDATFEFIVETSEPGADRPYDSVSLKPTEANLAGGRVAGTAANTTGKPLKGPFEDTSSVSTTPEDSQLKLGISPAPTGSTPTARHPSRWTWPPYRVRRSWWA